MQHRQAVPGLTRALELRGWSPADLTRHAGLDEKTVAKAVTGQPVRPGSARKIFEALEANPPLAAAVALYGGCRDIPSLP